MSKQSAIFPTILPETPSGKRQKFTLTRARDLEARLEAISMRAAGAIRELEAVGIHPDVAEQNPVRDDLTLVYPELTKIMESAAYAKARVASIVTILDL